MQVLKGEMAGRAGVSRAVHLVYWMTADYIFPAPRKGCPHRLEGST